MKINEDLIISIVSNILMLLILIIIMKFPTLSVIICYIFGFVLPYILKELWKFYNYLERSFRVMK